ncbi:MAG TPA: thioredoxin family protein [Opitutaceae bacterium]
MKSPLKSFLILAAISSAFVFGAQAKEAVIGQAAPDFTLTDITGKQHSLSSYRGKTVVLEWVNPECPFVIKHYGSGNMPNTQKAATADGVVWLTINSGVPGAQGDFDPAKASAWLKQQGAAPTAYFRDQNSAVGRLYGAKTTPHMYVINAEGTLVYNGAIDSIRSANVADIAKAENYVNSALAAVKAGKPVAKATSEPYGCNVKY